MILTCWAGLLPTAFGVLVSASAPGPESGRASARASSVVTSFLFGLRRRCEVVGLVTFDIKLACFMRRLSAFVVGKRSPEDFALGALLLDEAGLTEEDLRIDLVGAEVRWDGWIGAIAG